MSTAREAILEQLNRDFGIEPDPDGIKAERPIAQELQPDPKPEEAEEEQTELEDQAEGQEEESEETQEEEETQAEGLTQKLRAKQFAEQAGWTLEEFYRDVTVPTDEGEATLSEVVDGYKSLRAENETLRQERQALQEKAVQAGVPMQQYAPEAVQLYQKARYLEEQYQNTDWSKLDRAEALDLKFQLKDEIDKLDKAANAKQGEYARESEERMRTYVAEVDTQLRRDIPQWRNPQQRQTESEGIAAMLANEYGMDAGRINQILRFDAPSARIVRDLWEARKSKADTKRAVKKVEKIPRSMSPGARQEAAKPTLADIGKQIRQAERTRQGRKARDKIIETAEFDDALLKR